VQVPVGKAERAEKEAKYVKMLANAIAYVAKADLDTIPAESTSTRDEVGVDSRQRQKQRDNVRAGKGSGPYGLDAIGEPTDLFEEHARCRYLDLLAHEKNAEQRRVAEIVDKK
jgi:hypothetical protein